MKQNWEELCKNKLQLLLSIEAGFGYAVTQEEMSSHSMHDKSRKRPRITTKLKAYRKQKSDEKSSYDIET